ncbi:MAG: cytochrome c biogenesis protein CcsA [Saprospiraceae bacterium]|nr:cytochrome c biogenesis protein CcsA [Saprospiraceae bacterium]
MKSLIQSPIVKVPLALLGIPLFFLLFFLILGGIDSANNIGEHSWAGILGHNLIILAFVSSGFSSFAYMVANQKHQNNYLAQSKSWQSLGRIGFLIHGLSIFAIIGLIFFMMINRMYEYDYVLGHTSDDLPFRYIFSAFWEGQEGSFLLWMFWHVVLGFVLILTAKRWENPVMSVVGIIQAVLTTMILGIYLSESIHIGANPFLLFRDTESGLQYFSQFTQQLEAQIQLQPSRAAELEGMTYLTNLKGKGLNPLLQNYWMIIHPPTLFLGFASTLVPFAFAIAGLWTGEHRKWIRPALTWALFSGAILGTGILMGGVWAYEALSFGGYWAWDPVENASLVPWIILVAGIHTALVAKATGHSIRSTYIFFILTFILIIYSTFLTRSGILSDTSVHAFTEMGLMRQLVLFILSIIIIPFSLYFYRRKSIPKPAKEEGAVSRELWMFIGSLTLLFSACLITYTTSIPVWNAVADQFALLFGATGENPVADIAPPADDVAFYNQYQYPIGIAISILTAFTQFLHYRRSTMTPTQRNRFFAIIGICIALAIMASVLMSSMYPNINHAGYFILVICGFFTVFANLYYILTVVSGKIHVAGSVVAHIGFGLLMVGVVFSGALKNSISWDPKFNELDGALGGLNKQSNKNIRLPKGFPVKIQDNYTVTYAKRDTLYHDVLVPDGNGGTIQKKVDHSQAYHLVFEKTDPITGQVIEKFITKPNVLYKEQQAQANSLPKLKMEAANPDTRHYFSHDVFTLAIPEWAFEETGWITDTISMSDTIYTRKNYAVFDNIDAQMPTHDNYTYREGDIPITVVIRVHALDSDQYWEARPLYYIRDKSEFSIPDKIEELNLTFKVNKIIPPKNGEDKRRGRVVLEFLDKSERDFVVVQAIVFPMINLVWLGSIMMMLGLFMSMFQRRNKKRQEKEIIEV